MACTRVKVDRVYYDQSFTINDLVIEEARSLAGVAPGTVGAMDNPDIQSVSVEMTVTGCTLNRTTEGDLANTIDLSFFVLKTITFTNGVPVVFSFNVTEEDIPLPKLQDASLPTDIDRLKCQVFDFIPSESYSYDPANLTLNDTIDVAITIKIAAEEQLMVSLCPPELSRTVQGVEIIT